MLTRPGLLHREVGAAPSDRAVLVLYFAGLDDAYRVDDVGAALVRAFDRCMGDYGLSMIVDVDAEPPACDWSLSADQSGGYALHRPDAVSGSVTGFPAGWWHRAAVQAWRVPMLATCAPYGPTDRLWTDGDVVRTWLDGAARARRVWGGSVTVQTPRPPVPRNAR